MMKSVKTLSSAVVLTTLLAAAAALAAPDDVIHPYFPLQDGNRWIYVQRAQGIGGTPQDPYPMEEVEIIDRYRRNGHDVFVVDNYGFGIWQGSTHFFSDATGRTVEIQGDATGVWYPWRGPGTEVQIPEFGNDCVHGAKGLTLDLGPVAVPAGDFKDCLTINYHSRRCQEIGLLSETFAPGIGLIRRQVTSTDGEQTWELKYAEVNGYVFSGPLVGDVPAGDESQDGVVMAVENTTWGAIKSSYTR
jgi:hypothetical protein